MTATEGTMKVRPIEIPTDAPGALKEATIVDLPESGEIVVRFDEAAARLVACRFLETTSKDPPVLRKGDRVLVLSPEEPGGKGCVLGRIGVYRAPDRKRVVLDADEEITVRCGEGSITIRKSGKILVKGVEIVSHARGANRIRGGSVQLN